MVGAHPRAEARGPADPPDRQVRRAPPRKPEDVEGNLAAAPALMETATAVSSFAKSLFLGEIHEELFPFPSRTRGAGQDPRAHRAAAGDRRELIDPRKAEEQGWIGDDVIAALGEAGLCGLYVDEEYGGQGLSQTGYCRVSEVFAQIDPTLSVIMGVHQSIGHEADRCSAPTSRRPASCPTSPRSQARRLRADRAERRLGRERDRDDRDPPGGRVMGPERREALHRQRLEGVVLSTFARIEDTDEFIALIVERDGRASRSATATTRWDCARTTSATCTSTACGSRPRT